MNKQILGQHPTSLSFNRLTQELPTNFLFHIFIPVFLAVLQWNPFVVMTIEPQTVFTIQVCLLRQDEIACVQS